MKKLLLILLLAAFVGGAAAPISSSFPGFGPVTAYAQEGDQGEDNDDQGEDEQ